MKNKYLILTIFVIALSFIGCGKKTNNPEATITYNAEKAKMDNSSGFIDVDGSVEANDTKKIFVDKKLKVKEVLVQEGDFVEKGALLMTFDETERNNIKRNLEKEKINLSKLKRNYTVEKELNKIGGSSSNSVKELSEEIRTSEITIDFYREDLEKTAEKIESPVSGTITTLYAQENYSVNTDEPLLELADLSDIKIILEVPEYEVRDIELNQKLIIKPEVFEKKISYPGVITKISRVSQVSKTTSENVLEVEVKPTEKIPHIVPGFKVSSRIYLGKEEPGIVILSTALLFENDEYFIYKSDETGKISKTVVQFKDMKGDKVIITNGLAIGELFLLNPKESLKSGDTVALNILANEETLKRKGMKSQ
ncbi:MAG: efflux RND transporter periplasmic adaptor subunit [Cetobacterium sp.]